MEAGVSVAITLPKKAASGGTGFFSAITSLGASGRADDTAGRASGRKLAAWLSVDCSAGEIRWASLEQHQGRPSEEGCISVGELLYVRDTGVAVELCVKDQSQATVLEFCSSEDRSSWTTYLELAVEVLTPP